jgi:ribosome hibernation promoting factor
MLSRRLTLPNMKLDIRSPNLMVNDELRDHTKRNLHFSLGRLAPQIERVVVTVADINGPKGGLDKRCGVRVVGRDGWLVTVTHTERSSESAVSHAVARAARAVARRIERRRRPARSVLSRNLSLRG